MAPTEAMDDFMTAHSDREGIFGTREVFVTSETPVSLATVHRDIVATTETPAETGAHTPGRGTRETE